MLNSLTSLTIRKKLIILNILVLFLIFLLILAGWFGFRKIHEESLISSLLVQESIAIQGMSRGLGEFVVTQGTPSTAETVRDNIAKFQEAHARLSSVFMHRLSQDFEKLNENWTSIKNEMESFIRISRDGIGDEEMI